MTKITLRPDQAAVAAEVLDLDQSGARHLQAIPPLDDKGTLLGELLQAKAGELGVLLDSVQVDVRELQPAAIDAHQLKGGAGDRRGRPGAARHAADKSRLARAKLADQQHHVADAKAGSEALADCFGLGR